MDRRTFLKATPALAVGLAAPSALRKVVVVEGNSLSCMEAPAYGQPTCWPTLFATSALAQAHALRVVNVAVGATSIEEAIGRAPVYVDPVLADYDWSCLIVYEGGNHIGQRTQNGARSFERHVEYCRARRPLATRIVLATIPARANVGHWWEPARTEFNDLARARWHEFADALADLAALPELSDADDSRYFYDGVHTTLAANQITAGVMASAVAGLLPTAPGTVTRPQPVRSCLALPVLGR